MMTTVMVIAALILGFLAGYFTGRGSRSERPATWPIGRHRQ